MNMVYTFLIHWGLVTQNSSARVICTDIWAIIWLIQHQLTKQRWWKLLNLTHQELAKFPEQKTANLCAYLTRHAIYSMVIEVLWKLWQETIYNNLWSDRLHILCTLNINEVANMAKCSQQTSHGLLMGWDVWVFFFQKFWPLFCQCNYLDYATTCDTALCYHCSKNCHTCHIYDIIPVLLNFCCVAYNEAGISSMMKFGCLSYICDVAHQKSCISREKYDEMVMSWKLVNLLH